MSIRTEGAEGFELLQDLRAQVGGNGIEFDECRVVAVEIRGGDQQAAVFAAMVYAYILFMVFPIYNTLETLDRNQIDAARDLGASTWKLHWRVAIPHAKPGIASGSVMVFMLSAGSLLVPTILGSPQSQWFTEVIQERFFGSQDWNTGAAYAFILLLLCVVFVTLMMRVFRVSLADIAR